MLDYPSFWWFYSHWIFMGQNLMVYVESGCYVDFIVIASFMSTYPFDLTRNWLYLRIIPQHLTLWHFFFWRTKWETWTSLGWGTISMCYVMVYFTWIAYTHLGMMPQFIITWLIILKCGSYLIHHTFYVQYWWCFPSFMTFYIG